MCSEKRCSCHSAGHSCTEHKHTEEDQLAGDMKEDERERERLAMMNDLRIDELLASTNLCYCWN